MDDVPEPLRTQLLETTTSRNSGVIVIADKAGKEQLTQILARREGCRVGDADKEDAPGALRKTTLEAVPTPAMLRLPWLAWAGFILVLVLSAIVFALFQMRF